MRHALDHGFREVEVTPAAQEAWIQLLLSGPGMFIGASPDCTPGYYNNEGQPRGKGAELFVGYPLGATAFFKYIKDWRETGRFEGLEFR